MIPFRTQRLATTVVNRILNLRSEFKSGPQMQPPSLPAAPEPTPIAQQPAVPVDADPQTAQDIALSDLA